MIADAETQYVMQKEEWLRNLIKSILVECGTRDREHIKGPDPFQSDTALSPEHRWRKTKRKTKPD